MLPQKLLSLLHVLELFPALLRDFFGLVRHVEFVDCDEAAKAGEGVGEDFGPGGELVAVDGGGKEREGPGVDCEGGEGGLDCWWLAC